MSDEEEPTDPSAFSHLPSGQRLYHLVLAMSEEQILQSHEREGFWPDPHPERAHYPIMAELWSDVDEIADALLEEDPTDAVALDYRKRWSAYDAAYRDPRDRTWWMLPTEARERARIIKRFLLRAGPLSLRRREGDSSRDYWTKEALEYE